MRKLLFESLFRRPLTERAPSPDDAAVAELATALGAGRAATARPEPVDPRGRCRILQWMRAGNSRAQQRLLRRRAVRPAVRRLAAPCRRPDGDRTGDEKHARGARSAPIMRRPNPKWVVAVGDCARDGGCFAGSYAVVGGVSEVVPVDLHIPGCPPTPTAMLQGLAGAARTRGRGRRYLVRNAIGPAPAPSSFGGRSCSLSWDVSWIYLGICDMFAKAHPSPACRACGARIDQLDPGALERGNQFHQGIDVGADHTVAGFHALDGRHRKIGQFGDLPLIDAQKRARGPELIGGNHGGSSPGSEADISSPSKLPSQAST